MPKRLLEPTHDRVLIEIVQPRETTAGGIIIPENQRTPQPEGVVIAIGPGRSLDNGTKTTACVTVGDRVLLPQGHSFMFEFKRYMMVMDYEVPAIIRDTEDAPEPAA